MSDAAVADNPRAVIGGNLPPEPTPYEKSLKEIEDLYTEASLWLDGAAVDNQGLADGVGKLKGMLRAATARAEAARVAEKTPHDDKIAEIQERYNLLIGDTKKVKGKAVRAIEACNAALKPWLDAEDKRIAEEARVKREAAEKARREAEEAIRTTDAANLAARAEAEELVARAKAAATVANKAERQTAKVSGGPGRAVGLRTTYLTTITDPVEFGRYAWKQHRTEYESFLLDLAKSLVASGSRTLPGVLINAEKVV